MGRSRLSRLRKRHHHEHRITQASRVPGVVPGETQSIAVTGVKDAGLGKTMGKVSGIQPPQGVWTVF